MIEKLSNAIAIKIKEANPLETKSVELMVYSISILINLLSTILLLLLGSVFLNNTGEVFTALFFLALLRAFSGGYHFKSLTVCAVISAILLIVATQIDFSTSVMFIINAFGLAIMILKAPVNFTETTIVAKTKFIYFKIVAVCIVGINLIIQNDILTAIILLQSASMINGRRWILK